MQHISGEPGLVSNFTWESSSNNLKFRIKKVNALIYSAMFTQIHFSSRTWLQRLSLLSVGGYLREVCCVVVKLLLKHQPLFSSIACVGPLLGPLLGRLHYAFLLQLRGFLIYFGWYSHAPWKTPPAQVDIPATECQRGWRISGKEGKGGRRSGPDIVSYTLQ